MYRYICVRVCVCVCFATSVDHRVIVKESGNVNKYLNLKTCDT